MEYLAPLNIRNAENVRLAKDLADIEGKPITAVVTEALREKRARERNEALLFTGDAFFHTDIRPALTS